MKNKYRILLLIGIYTTLFCSCSVEKDMDTPTQSPGETTTLDEVQVPASFDFATTTEIALEVKSKFSPVQSIMTFYFIDNNGQYIKLGKGLSDSTGNLSYTVTVPTYVNQLYITKSARGVEWFEIVNVTSDNLVVNFDITSQKLENSSSNGRTNACEDKFFAVNSFGETFAINVESSYSITDNPDLVGGSIANAYDQSINIMYYGSGTKLYAYDIGTGVSTLISTLNTSSSKLNNGFPRMAFKNGKLFIGEGTDVAILDAATGTQIKSLTITGIPSDKNGGGDIAFHSNGNLYQACSGGLYQLNFNADSTVLEASRVSADDFPYYLTGVTFDRFDNLYASTNGSTSKIIQMDVNDGSYTIAQSLTRKVNDLTSFRCTVADFGDVDTDNDGVVDGFDEYPEDPDRAFNNYNPGENGFGTFAFEDLYPQKGDYDFNDIMIHYRHNFVTNASNNVVEIKTKYVVSTVESDLPSGFGIELPIHSDSISTVTGTRNLNDVVGYTAKGLESGLADDKPCVIVFDNHFGLISGAGDIKKSDDIDMMISFVNAVPLSSIPVVEFNPFIFINKDRSKEVHLVNFSPTSKYNTNYRNSGDDDGNYATEAGHPWGLHIAHKFHPPKENIDITNAYLNFKTYVETGGGSNSNWYTDDAGNREMSKIHLNE